MARAGIEQAVWIGYSLEQLQTLQSCPVTPLAFPICFTSKRISFIENIARREARLARIDAENVVRAARKDKLKARNEKSDAPSHSNYIAYLGPRVEAFAHAFGGFGRVKR